MRPEITLYNISRNARHDWEGKSRNFHVFHKTIKECITTIMQSAGLSVTGNQEGRGEILYLQQRHSFTIT